MAAMGVLEKKAIEYAMAGNHKAAADIYEKLANLRLDIDMACQYMSCALQAGKVMDALHMVDKYVNLLKGEIKPQYKNFYLHASFAAFSGTLYEEALYFANQAEHCDDTDDRIFLQRLCCETVLGFSDNVRADEGRLLDFLEQFCNGELGDGMTIPPLMVLSWFANGDLLYRVSKQNAKLLNQTETVFSHMPTIDHFTKEKIKIGYICGHVREHPAVHVAWNHFAQHNKDRFETHGFFYNANYEYEGAKIMAESFDGYSDLDDMTDLEAAHYIKDMGIDILVDLSSMVEGDRPAIIAHKPAPIIMHYQGYHCTTCIDAIDYKITDAYTTPMSDWPIYSEKMAYIPVFCQTSRWTLPIDKSQQDRSLWGLPEDAFVFGNMCSTMKYTPEILSAWMTILDNVDGSVLWMPEPKYGNTRDVINFYAQENGIAKDRIIFAPRAKDKTQHLSRLPCMDMHLDTPIFTGHTTTVDMVEMGVFPLCMQGSHPPSDFSHSIMKHIDCADMVAKDLDEYIKTAVVLGRDRELTKTWCAKIAHQVEATDFLNTKALIGHLENAYQMAYIRWISGLEPEHFTAEPMEEENTMVLDDVNHLVSQETHERISGYSERA